MRQLRFTVTHEQGLHARPADDFVRFAKTLPCEIRLRKGDTEVDAKRLLAVMGLNVMAGEEILLSFRGAGEGGACQSMEQYLKTHL